MPDRSDPPRPGYSSLRQHRWSAAGIDYFVTLNARRPTGALIEPEVLGAIVQQREHLHQRGQWSMRSCVVMPDHIHLLFTLGESQSLATTLRNFKGPLTPFFRRRELHWQEGYYEHRLRPDDDRLSVFLYIFLNPYRANLAVPSEKWPGYFCAPDDWGWLEPLTNQETPFPEWLR